MPEVMLGKTSSNKIVAIQVDNNGAIVISDGTDALDTTPGKYAEATFTPAADLA